MIENFYICRQGKVRSSNQDRAGCFSIDNWCLGFVADGMGGHYGGEQASEIVAQACARWWNTFVTSPQRPGFLQSQEQLRGLLHHCHEEISKIAPPQTVCGTTAVLLWIAGNEYALFSVGDSRCYIVTRRLGFSQKPIQLTYDDVSTEPHLAGKLTRALGPGRCSLSLRTGTIHTKTTKTLFALCSDGIYKACPGLLGELKKISVQKSLMDATNQIAAQVDANGAPDNYSLVLLRI